MDTKAVRDVAPPKSSVNTIEIETLSLHTIECETLSLEDHEEETFDPRNTAKLRTTNWRG